jgi:hypothetical protein
MNLFPVNQQRKISQFKRTTILIGSVFILASISAVYTAIYATSNIGEYPESWLASTIFGRLLELIGASIILTNYGLNLWNWKPKKEIMEINIELDSIDSIN